MLREETVNRAGPGSSAGEGVSPRGEWHAGAVDSGATPDQTDVSGCLQKGLVMQLPQRPLADYLSKPYRAYMEQISHVLQIDRGVCHSKSWCREWTHSHTHPRDRAEAVSAGDRGFPIVPLREQWQMGKRLVYQLCKEVPSDLSKANTNLVQKT